MVRRKRKKSARSEDGDDSGNSNIKLFDQRKKLVRYRKINRIPGIYICGSLQASRWWQSNLARSQISLRTEVK